jgi:hypothetical protein
VVKSRKSALLLSAAAVLAFTVTSALLNILLPYLLTGDARTVIQNPERLTQPSQLIALAAILALFLLLMTGLGAFWLYRFFGEAYYGPHGAARWAIFGALLAVFLKLPDWLFAGSLRWVEYAVWIISPFLAFFAARWLLPLGKK